MDRITVRLTGPAKIGRGWFKSGDEPSVTPDEARQLKAAGLIDNEIKASLDLTLDTTGVRDAVAATANDFIAAAVEAATSDLVAERDEARDRAFDAEARATALEGRIQDLEAQLAAIPPEGSPPEKSASAPEDGSVDAGKSVPKKTGTKKG